MITGCIIGGCESEDPIPIHDTVLRNADIQNINNNNQSYATKCNMKTYSIQIPNKNGCNLNAPPTFESFIEIPQKLIQHFWLYICPLWQLKFELKHFEDQNLC